MKRMMHHLYWVLKGVKVYALVGKSGTGKSFRAKLVADKYHISHIIDDGLLIRDNKIVAGKTAKQASGYLTAVKTAVFDDEEHREVVHKALTKEQFTKILLIGTSKKMVTKIADRLELPHIFKFIQIEEIASKDEIEEALKSRTNEQRHVIPVPAVEVGKDYSHILADSVKIFIKSGLSFFKKKKHFEKAVVRPDFHKKRGRVTISESALSQMVLHCIDEFNDMISVSKITIKHRPDGYVVLLQIVVPYGESLPGSLQKLQQYIIESISRYTGILLEEVHITVDNIQGGF